MANFYLRDLVPMLARAIKDLGIMNRDDFCGTGDGIKTSFRTTDYPVKIDSLTAYIDEVDTAINSADYAYGLFTFATAPTSGTRITANYVYYNYPDGLLQDYIADAVIRLELIYYQGYVVLRDESGATPTYDAYLESEPNQRTQMLFVLQATIDFVNAGLAEDNLIVTREWRDEEVEESYTKSAQLARAYLDRLYSERDKIIAGLQVRNSTYGYRLETRFNTDESRYRYIEGISPVIES